MSRLSPLGYVANVAGTQLLGAIMASTPAAEARRSVLQGMVGPTRSPYGFNSSFLYHAPAIHASGNITQPPANVRALLNQLEYKQVDEGVSLFQGLFSDWGIGNAFEGCREDFREVLKAVQSTTPYGPLSVQKFDLTLEQCIQSIANKLSVASVFLNITDGIGQMAGIAQISQHQKSEILNTGRIIFNARHRALAGIDKASDLMTIADLVMKAYKLPSSNDQIALGSRHSERDEIVASMAISSITAATGKALGTVASRAPIPGFAAAAIGMATWAVSNNEHLTMVAADMIRTARDGMPELSKMESNSKQGSSIPLWDL